MNAVMSLQEVKQKNFKNRIDNDILFVFSQLVN